MIEATASKNKQEPLQPPSQVTRPEVESLQLFGGSKELRIHHDGEYYTLRHTSKGKLILTK